jgi:hypothetical protein
VILVTPGLNHHISKTDYISYTEQIRRIAVCPLYYIHVYYIYVSHLCTSICTYVSRHGKSNRILYIINATIGIRTGICRVNDSIFLIDRYSHGFFSCRRDDYIRGTLTFYWKLVSVFGRRNAHAHHIIDGIYRLWYRYV